MLTLKHFDTVTGKWIEIPNPDSSLAGEPDRIVLTETIAPTVLEAIVREGFPDEDVTGWFSVGDLDELSTVAEVNRHPLGHVPLLSSKGRVIYGPEKVWPLIARANIDPDRPNLLNPSAYGSTQIGGCPIYFEREIDYLIVDRLTGENGGYLPDDVARNLVSDGGGTIQPAVAREVFQTETHLIQFRMFDRDRFWYFKGTVAAAPVEPAGATPDGRPITLVMSADSAKGAAKTRIAPGLYRARVWFGEKERSVRGTMAMSQPLSDSIEAFGDRLPGIREALSSLQEILTDPRELIRAFVNDHEERARASDGNWRPPSPGETVERYRRSVNPSRTSGDVSPREDFIYLALKAYPDPASHPLIGLPKFKRALTEFVRGAFLDTATGKIHRADRGMAMASGDLRYGEICVPWIADGAVVMGWRSPYLNYNGQRIFVNRHIDAMYAPNGKLREGTILINRETWGELAVRARARALEVSGRLNNIGDAGLPPLPRTLSESDSASLEERVSYTDRFNGAIDLLNRGSATNLPSLPYESDIEAMALDFDGDCIGVVEAARFPRYYREQSRRLLAEPYPPTFKRPKIPVPEGTDLATAILHAADATSVGTINNLLQAVTSLEAELKLFATRSRDDLRREYALTLQRGARSALTGTGDRRHPLTLPPSILTPLVALAGANPDGLEGIETVYSLQGRVYREMVRELSAHNQDAVDLFKSWYKPDMEAVRSLSYPLYRKMDIIGDRKQPAVFLSRPLKVNGYSPHELSARLTGDAFDEYRVGVYPMEAFRQFAPEGFTPDQLAVVRDIKARYDALFNRAARRSGREASGEGHFFRIGIEGGDTIEVSGYKHFLSHGEARGLTGSDSITLRIVPDGRDGRLPLVTLKRPDGGYLPIGTLNPSDNPRAIPGGEFKALSISIERPLSAGEIGSLFDRARRLARDWRAGLDASSSEGEARGYFQAAWYLATRPDSKNPYKVDNFVFDAFGDSILELLSRGRYPYTTFRATGSDRDFNLLPETLRRIDTEIDFKIDIDPGDRAKYWYAREPETGDYRRFAGVSESTYPLPPGTRARGTVRRDLATTAYLEIEGLGRPVIFGNRDKFPAFDREYGDDIHAVIFKLGPTPPVLYLQEGDNKLGKFSADSVALLRERGLEGRDLPEISFALDTGANRRYLIARAEGLPPLYILPVHPDSPLREHAGRTIRARAVSERPKREMMGVYIRDPDGPLVPIGQFTDNWKESRAILRAAGLFESGVEVRARIRDRVTAVSIEIDPETLEFPPVGRVSRPPLSPGVRPPLVDTITERFLSALCYQPIVLCLHPGEWRFHGGGVGVLPTVSVAIDSRLSRGFGEKLRSLNVPHVILANDDPRARAESVRGLLCFRLVAGDLTGGVLERIRSLDPSWKPALLSRGDYNARLETLVIPEPFGWREIQAVHARGRSGGDYLDINAVPLRKLPTLLVGWGIAPSAGDGHRERAIWSLAVDITSSEAAADFLKRHGIHHAVSAIPPGSGGGIESGYRVFEFEEAGIPEDFKRLLPAKFGEPLDIQDYRRRLEELEKGSLSVSLDVIIEKAVAEPLYRAETARNRDSHRDKALTGSTCIYPIEAGADGSEFSSNGDSSEREMERPARASRSPDSLEASIPLEREYTLENLELQRERTLSVAPVASALLKAGTLDGSPRVHRDGGSGTLSYIGERYTIAWNGEELTLTDRTTAVVKMVARPFREPAGDELRWLALPLPPGSPGLSSEEVELFTAPATVRVIKEVLLRSGRGLVG